MRLPDRARRLGAVAALAAIGAIATLGILALTDDDEQEAGSPPADVAVDERPAGRADGDPAEADGRRRRPAREGAPSPESVEERRVERTVRRYVAALNDRDGERVCALLAPGALHEVELPRDGGDCGEALSASIGYRDPRGFPQWERASLERFRSIELDGDQARATATIVSDFADRDEPSVEDDVIYLERRADRWLLVRPSAVLYRAIGAPDLPLDLLSPPD